MTPDQFDIETVLPLSRCCECNKELDRAGGPREAKSGDFTLCINCGSLNVFGDDLMLRQPTEDEYLESTKMQDLQIARQIINSLNEKRS